MKPPSHDARSGPRLVGRWFALAAGALAAPGAALGSLELLDTASTIVIGDCAAWAEAESSSFSVLAWIFPTAPVAGNEAIFQIDGVLTADLDPGGRFRATMHRAAPEPSALSAVAPGVIPAMRWSLIAVSFDRDSGQLTAWRRSEQDAPGQSTAAIPGFLPGPLGGEARLGAVGGASFVGVIGAISLREELIGALDVDAVWSSRAHSSIHDLKTDDVGGALTGPSGCLWLTGHAVTTEPTNAIDDQLPAHMIAAHLGDPVTPTNLVVYDTGAASSPNNLNTVRPVLDVALARHVSPFDFGLPSYFLPGLPFTTPAFPEESIVPFPAGKARRLVTGPVGLVRVITSANSRGVRSDDGSGEPGNYAHGFLAEMSASIAGVLSRPAALGVAPWFAFDCSESGAFVDGPVFDIAQMDYSRFWTGSAKAQSIGPGRGLAIEGGGVFILRSKPEGLMTAEAPLVLETHLLRFPGAGQVRVTPNAAESQGLLGSDVAPSVELSLDSTAWSRAYADAEDAYSSATSTLTLEGDCTGVVQSGWAVQFRGRISLVESIEFGQASPGKSTIRLEHPFKSGPLDGDVLEFGPWSYETIVMTLPPVPSGSGSIWRGAKVASLVDDRDVVLFGHSVYRPDVNGFAFAAAGWGGQGYEPQETRAFRAAVTGWMQELRPDVWLQMFAQHYSEEESMSTWLGLVREAVPEADVVWLGDMSHVTTWESWHRYILQNAAAEGLPAVSLLTHPQLGVLLDQYADGLRSDTSHISYRGNKRLARLWLEALDEAAAPEWDAADIDGSGTVDFADLNFLLGSWNTVGDLLAADIDRDGDVDFSDLNLLLSAYGR